MMSSLYFHIFLSFMSVMSWARSQVSHSSLSIPLTKIKTEDELQWLRTNTNDLKMPHFLQIRNRLRNTISSRSRLSQKTPLEAEVLAPKKLVRNDYSLATITSVIVAFSFFRQLTMG